MKISTFVLGGVFAAWAGLAQAATLTVQDSLPTDFDGLITFNDTGLANFSTITDEFIAEGAVFTTHNISSKYTLRNNSDGGILFQFGRGVSAAIQFTAPVREAFFAIGSNQGSATFSTYLNDVQVGGSVAASIAGTAFLPSDPDAQPNVFVFGGGVFDEIRFTTSNASTGYSIDNVGFTLAAVPLPAGLPLLLAGLGAFGVVRRRQRQS